MIRCLMRRSDTDLLVWNCQLNDHADTASQDTLGFWLIEKGFDFAFELSTPKAALLNRLWHWILRQTKVKNRNRNHSRQYRVNP